MRGVLTATVLAGLAAAAPAQAMDVTFTGSFFDVFVEIDGVAPPGGNPTELTIILRGDSGNVVPGDTVGGLVSSNALPIESATVVVGAEASQTVPLSFGDVFLLASESTEDLSVLVDQGGPDPENNGGYITQALTPGYVFDHDIEDLSPLDAVMATALINTMTIIPLTFPGLAPNGDGLEILGFGTAFVPEFSFGSGQYRIDVASKAIPVPGSLPLMALGLGMMLLGRRRPGARR